MTWIFSDPHGELEKLKEAFSKAPIEEEDLIIGLGDYIDRGPDSFGVVQFLIDLSKIYKCIFLKGNHDDTWMESFIHGRVNPLWKDGGLETAISYDNNDGFNNEEHKQFFLNLQNYYLDEEDNLFVHAGINRHLRLYKQDSKIFFWDRDLWYSAIGHHNAKNLDKFKIKEDFKHIYIGHTPTQHFGKDKPITIYNITCIDTGSGKGGVFTLMNIDTKEIYQSN